MIGLMLRRLESALGRRTWQEVSTVACGFANTF
jgi:hypothetical protein